MNTNTKNRKRTSDFLTGVAVFFFPFFLHSLRWEFRRGGNEFLFCLFLLLYLFFPPLYTWAQVIRKWLSWNWFMPCTGKSRGHICWAAGGKKKEKGVECIIIPNVQSNFPILSLCFLFFLVFSPQKEKKKFKFKPAWNKWMETSVCCCGLDSVSLHTHTYIYNCAGGTCQTGCNASYYTIVPVFDL